MGAWERVERLEVGGEIDSDHHSVTVWLGRREKGGKRVEEEEWMECGLVGGGKGGI